MRPPGKIRLLKFISNFNIGGTERQFVTGVRELDLARFDLRVACFKRTGAFQEAIASLDLPLGEYPIHSLYDLRSLRQRARFVGDVRRHRTQIVHSYGFYPNMFAVPAAWWARVPVILAAIRDTGDPWTPAQRLAQRQICRLADHVLVNAHAVAERLVAEGYARSRISVIHNGVDASRFLPRRACPELRRQLGVAPAAPLVVVISRLSRYHGIESKGIDYFLAAAVRVAAEYDDARFLIVGDGVSRRELESTARRLGLGERVIFTGARLDVPQILSEATISVLPTLTEALSNSLLEATAAGVPVVATQVGGNPEVVADGETGLLVPAEDAAGLAQAILRLLARPELRERFGAAGRQRAERLFSVTRMVRATEKLYLELLER
ncbi:MAG TPA: glycosyltransferase, partial [Candidatus Polarisedimenticolaceae bacterium]|nr:glycosyltransferase [Candidatus Polarisedimenticolaceae bacterium]